MQLKEHPGARVSEVQLRFQHRGSMCLSSFFVQLEEEIQRLRQTNSDLSALYLDLLEKSERTPSDAMQSGQVVRQTTSGQVQDRTDFGTDFGCEEFVQYMGTKRPESAAPFSSSAHCTSTECARQIDILRDTNNDLRRELAEQRILYEAQLESLRAEMAQQQQCLADFLATSEPPHTPTGMTTASLTHTVALWYLSPSRICLSRSVHPRQAHLHLRRDAAVPSHAIAGKKSEPGAHC